MVVRGSGRDEEVTVVEGASGEAEEVLLVATTPTGSDWVGE